MLTGLAVGLGLERPWTLRHSRVVRPNPAMAGGVETFHL